jgi:phosphopantothenoylcysteine decarboxylase/phosphopantothenate--cysteine ligase
MRILITAGGTREYIDPVRFIANASSGKMGYALAFAALKAGHEVTLISASDLQPPAGVDFVGVESAKDMFNAVKKFFPKCDCLIMAAAVADYTPAKPAKRKIERTNKPISVKLKPTPDILKWASKHKNKNQIVCGFALADRELRRNAERKLREKNLDMIIANTPDSIGSDKSTVHIKTPGSGWIKLPLASKAVIARRIVNLLSH